jgi:hypothetical protein
MVMWPAHCCQNKIQIRWGKVLIQLSNLLHLLPVTDGVICLVEPSTITDLHAVVSTRNTPQICHNGLE